MSIRIRNDNYWKKRSMQRLVDAEKNSLPYLRQIKKLYRNSAKDTVETVRGLYKTYYKGKDGFDIKALEKIANTGDLKRFKAELKREGLSTYLPEHYRGRLDRAELLNAKLWAETKKIAFQEQEISTESYNKTLKDTYNKTIYDISKGVNKNIAFAEIPQKTIDEVLNAKFYGENYSQRVWHNTGKLANKIQEIIGQSILTGQSQAKTIRQVLEAYGTRGKPKGGYYDAERLIRTETNYFENKAEVLSYEEIGIKKFKYLAVLDNRTSEICQEMDGKIFDVKDSVQGENTPPLHPNCRSTIVPYIGKEYEPETRIARNPETGKNYYIENMNYREWEEKYVNAENKNENDMSNNTKQEPRKLLSRAETLERYQNYGFMELNNNLRKEVPLNKEEKLLDDSLQKLFKEEKPLKEEKNVYRYSNGAVSVKLFKETGLDEYFRKENLPSNTTLMDIFSNKKYEEKIRESLIDKIFEDKGYVSTTSSYSSFTKFANAKSDTAFFYNSGFNDSMQIKIPKGKKVLDLGENGAILGSEENEIILNKGAKFKIKDLRFDWTSNSVLFECDYL